MFRLSQSTHLFFWNHHSYGSLWGALLQANSTPMAKALGSIEASIRFVIWLHSAFVSFFLVVLRYVRSWDLDFGNLIIKAQVPEYVISDELQNKNLPKLPHSDLRWFTTPLFTERKNKNTRNLYFHRWHEIVSACCCSRYSWDTCSPLYLRKPLTASL